MRPVNHKLTRFSSISATGPLGLCAQQGPRGPFSYFQMQQATAAILHCRPIPLPPPPTFIVGEDPLGLLVLPVQSQQRLEPRSTGTLLSPERIPSASSSFPCSRSDEWSPEAPAHQPPSTVTVQRRRRPGSVSSTSPPRAAPEPLSPPRAPQLPPASCSHHSARFWRATRVRCHEVHHEPEACMVHGSWTESVAFLMRKQFSYSR
jgi:hypothetical protein